MSDITLVRKYVLFFKEQINIITPYLHYFPQELSSELTQLNLQIINCETTLLFGGSLDEKHASSILTKVEPLSRAINVTLTKLLRELLGKIEASMITPTMRLKILSKRLIALETLSRKLSEVKLLVSAEMSAEQRLSKLIDFYVVQIVGTLSPYIHYLPIEIEDEVLALRDNLERILITCKTGVGVSEELPTSFKEAIDRIIPTHSKLIQKIQIVLRKTNEETMALSSRH